MSYRFDVTEYHKVSTQKERRARREKMVSWLETQVGPTLKTHLDGTPYLGEGWSFESVREFIGEQQTDDLFIRMYDTKLMLNLLDEGKAAMFKLTWCYEL